MGKHKD